MASELGAYYITIMPSLQGAKKQIESQLSGVDTATVGATLGSKLSSNLVKGLSLGAIGAKFSELGSSLESAGDKLTSAITKPFLVGAGIIGTAAAAIGGSALSAYASWEQLVGGVDTLFGDASATVQQYAANAYKTAGLSANAYMEQVTSFSASLVQSLGGDTAKAAEAGNQAIVDMSDNANKMGSSMTDIQNAYQGFAKQNYTMLDNLKLGYGGTKTEMERLIADANKVKSANGEMADLSIDSFADVVEAIHTVQTEMGITGTTAEEAATTIEGSVSSMKAAWGNWLAELGKDDADIPGLTKELADSFATALGNIVPRVQQIFKSLWDNMPAIVDSVLAVLPAKFQGLADLIVKGDFTSKLREAFGWEEDSPIVDKILTIRDAIVGLFKIVAQGDFSSELRRAFNIEEDSPIVGFLLTVHDNLGKIIATAVLAGPALKVLGKGFGFIGSVTTNLGKLVSWAGKLAPALSGAGGGVTSLLKIFTRFLGPVGLAIAAIAALWSQSEAFRDGVKEVAQFLWDAVQQVWSAIQPVISSVASALSPLVQQIKNIVGQIGDYIGQVMSLIAPMISGVATAISGIISLAAPVVEWIIATLIPIFQEILTVVMNVFTAIQPVINGAMTVIQAIISTVMSVISGDWSGAWDGIKGIFSAVWDLIPTILSAGFEILKTLVSGAMSIISSLWSSAWSAIEGFLSWIWSAISSTASSIWNGMVSFFTGIPGRIKSGLSALGSLASSVGSWFGSAKDAAVSKFNELVSWVGGIPSRIVSALGNVGSLLWDAGSRIISGLWDGLKSKFEDVKSWVSGIGDWIADHKGPKAYDLKLLVPNGQWIMGGLAEGLESSFHDRVMGSVSAMGSTLANELQATTRTTLSASVSSSPVVGVGASSSDSFAHIDPEDMAALAEKVASALYAAMTGSSRSLSLQSKAGVVI